MLMAISTAEKWLSHTKSGHFFFFFFFFFFLNGRRAPSPAFLKNGRRALTLDISKKSQAF